MKINFFFNFFLKRGNLDRGYHTPETLRPQEFKKGLKKFKSLDFGKKPPGPHVENTKMLEQERRKLEAHAYRQKLLKKTALSTKQLKKSATKDQQEDGSFSPGYQKERLSENIRKQTQIKKKQSRDTATFSQCVFNMANILMVSDKREMSIKL